MAAIANVNLDTTFDTWRIRTNRAFTKLNALSSEDVITTISANTIQANVALIALGYANVQGQFTANNVIRVRGASTFPTEDGLEIGWLNSNNAYFAGYKDRATDERGMARFDFSSYQFDTNGSYDGGYDFKFNGAARFAITNTGIAFANAATTAALSLQSANTDTIVHVETTSDSTAAGPIVTLLRKPPAAAADDKLGQIIFQGIDNAAARKDYASITGAIGDHSAGLEDGKILLNVMKAGSTVTPAEISNTGLLVNTNYKAMFGANTWISQISSNCIAVGANTAAGSRKMVVSSNGVGVMTTGTYPSTEFHIQSGNQRLDDSYGIQWGSTFDRITGGTNYLNLWTGNAVKQQIMEHRIVYSANMMPVVGGTFNFGESGTRWKSFYGDNGYFRYMTVTGSELRTTTANTNIWGGHLNITANSHFKQQVTFDQACIFSQYTATTSGTVTLDFDAYNNFFLTLNGGLVLANPSTEAVGQFGVIVLMQDGTGGRTLSLGTDYESVQAAGYTLSTGSNALDVIPYYVVATDRVLLGMIQKTMG